MPSERHPLCAGLEQLRQTGRLPESEHPDFTELLALEAGELPEARARVLSRHLDTCPVCRDLLADWARFPDLELPAGMESPDEDRMAAGRAELLRQIEDDEARDRLAAFRPIEPPVPARRVRRPFLVRTALPLAAVVLVAIGLAVFLAGKGRGVPVPAPDAQFVEVALQTSRHRGIRSPSNLATARQIFLHIESVPPGFDRYGASLLDRERGTVALEVRLYQADQRLVGAIEPGELLPGLYELSVWGRRAGEETRFDGPLILRVE